MRLAGRPLATQAPAPKRRGGDGPSAVGARGGRATARTQQPDAALLPQPLAAPAQPASLHELLLAALLSGAGGAQVPQPPPQPQPTAPARRHPAPAPDSESDDTAPSKPGAQPAPKRRLTDQQARVRGPRQAPRRRLRRLAPTPAAARNLPRAGPSRARSAAHAGTAGRGCRAALQPRLRHGGCRAGPPARAGGDLTGRREGALGLPHP